MVRDALVKTHSKYISLIRSILKREGYRVASCGASVFIKHIEQGVLPENLRSELGPFLLVMTSVSEQIEQSSEQLKEQAANHEVAKRFCTVPVACPGLLEPLARTVAREA